MLLFTTGYTHVSVFGMQFLIFLFYTFLLLCLLLFSCVFSFLTKNFIFIFHFHFCFFFSYLNLQLLPVTLSLLGSLGSLSSLSSLGFLRFSSISFFWKSSSYTVLVKIIIRSIRVDAGVQSSRWNDDSDNNNITNNIPIINDNNYTLSLSFPFTLIHFAAFSVRNFNIHPVGIHLQPTTTSTTTSSFWSCCWDCRYKTINLGLLYSSLPLVLYFSFFLSILSLRPSCHLLLATSNTLICSLLLVSPATLPLR